MAEKVLTLPLSGLEVRNAILDKISQSLQKDCFLSPSTAYDFFSASVKISLKCHDVGRVAEVEQEVTATAGENPDALLEAADAEFDIEPAPPNEIRVETGQEVPILSKDKSGKQEVRGIRYKRGAAKKAV